MWRFVSAARMAQIKADARAEGYIKAVREGLAANDAAKDLRSVTRENTQAANTAVQEMQAEMKQAVVKQIASKNRIIESPWEIEPLIMQMCGDRTYKAISKHIIRKYGDKVLGKNRPITMNQKTVERIVKRELRYDPKTQRFINHRNNNHRSC